MQREANNHPQYPIGRYQPAAVRTLSGKKLSDLTLAAVVNGEVDDMDVRISPETLRMQADIAAAAGRKTLADNFRRAAELCRLPDETILKIYEALRPARSTRGGLEHIAATLESSGAVLCAAMVRDAIAPYAKSGFLKTAHAA